MFDNPGNKIKSVALVFFILDVIGSIVGGVILCSNGMAAIGLSLVFVGPIFSWLVALFVYGFGDLVENSAFLAEEAERQSEKKQKKYEQKSKPAEKKDNRPVSPDKSGKDSPKVKTPPYEVSEQKDFSLEETNYVDIVCPDCFEKLSFPEPEVMSSKVLTCPYCLAEISTGKYR